MLAAAGHAPQAGRMHARGPTPEWYVISLRPRGAHAAVQRAAARRGAGVLALSPWCLRMRDDPSTRDALARALAASRVVFTSPMAVRAAGALQSLAPVPLREYIAVGAGTAAALRRAGATRVHAPARMDSEGTARAAGPAGHRRHRPRPGHCTGGRGVLAPALQARGARVLRADVYVREPVPPAARAVEALLALREPAVLLLSSGGALAGILESLPAAARVKVARAARGRGQRPVAGHGGSRGVRTRGARRRAAAGPAGGCRHRAAREPPGLTRSASMPGNPAEPAP